MTEQEWLTREPRLVQEINENLEAIKQIENARDISVGKLLIEARSQVRIRTFNAWVAEEFGMTAKRAAELIKAARQSGFADFQFGKHQKGSTNNDSN